MTDFLTEFTAKLPEDSPLAEADVARLLRSWGVQDTASGLIGLINNGHMRRTEDGALVRCVRSEPPREAPRVLDDNPTYPGFRLAVRQIVAEQLRELGVI